MVTSKVLPGTSAKLKQEPLGQLILEFMIIWRALFRYYNIVGNAPVISRDPSGIDLL